ncbi:MAG: hypothetical protein ACRDIZ_05270 [Actinomycetota bacterium]
MTDGEKITGTRDEHYDLVSVLYHTLQEADTIQGYIEIASFLKQVQEEDRSRAEQAKKLLLARLS